MSKALPPIQDNSKSDYIRPEDRQFKVRASPLDKRDIIVGESIYQDEIVSIDKPIDLRPKLQDVRNQGTTSMCAAFSAATIKEYQESKDMSLSEHFSPEWVYHHRENQESDGMYVRDVMRIMQKRGVPREVSWKFGEDKTTNKTLWKSLENESANHTIERYARCNTIEDTKKALHLCGPCIISVPVYRDAQQYSDQIWKKYSGNDKMIGGHAMVIVGYTNKNFIIRNSWGRNWGKNGYVYMDFDDFEHIWDVFCTYDAESDRNYVYDKKSEPKPKPKPNPGPGPSTPKKKKAKCGSCDIQ